MGEDEVTTETTIPQGTGSAGKDEVPQFMKDMDKIKPVKPITTIPSKPIRIHVNNPQKIRAGYLEQRLAEQELLRKGGTKRRPNY